MEESSGQKQEELNRSEKDSQPEALSEDPQEANSQQSEDVAASPFRDSVVDPGETNFWLKEGEFRAIWKVSVYGTIVFFGVIASAVVVYTLLPGADWRFTTPILTLASAMIASVFCAQLIDRKPLLDLIGLRPHSRAHRQLLIGILITLLLMLLLLGMELLFGEARIQSGHVTLSHTLSILLYGFTSFILVGFAEEILVRGYAFRVLEKEANTIIALLVTSGIFSLMHAANPGIGWIGFANIFLAGIWLGVARVVTGSLWLSVGMHIGWNFFLGPVFGFPVSGVIERSLFITKPAGADWISGGIFGPEGGILVTVLLIGATAALYHPVLQRFISPERIEDIEIETNEVHE